MGDESIDMVILESYMGYLVTLPIRWCSPSHRMASTSTIKDENAFDDVMGNI
jgi:hypothetical protein